MSSSSSRSAQAGIVADQPDRFFDVLRAFIAAFEQTQLLRARRESRCPLRPRRDAPLQRAHPRRCGLAEKQSGRPCRVSAPTDPRMPGVRLAEIHGRSERPPVVPSPAIAVLAVLVTIAVSESPCVVLLNPLAPASLIPVVLMGSEQGGRQEKRTDQNHNSY